MTMIIDGTQGITFPDTSKQYNSYYSFKNRIINGAMVIDQRNAGASVTPTSGGTYTVDRFTVREDTDGSATVQRSTVAPAGFVNSLLFTVTSADSSLGATQFVDISQRIEGLNMADFGWGAANATTVTVSFWVRSSVTGTYVVCPQNASFNRSYPATYTVNAANTWEYKTITIPGDTSGTWLTDNGVGMFLSFALACGTTYQGTANTWNAAGTISTSSAVNLMATNGATFYITGVQLEKGIVATSFDYRPYGTELALCQRYLPAFISTSTNDTLPGSFFGAASTAASGAYVFMTRARVRPTGITVSAGSHFTLTRPSTGTVVATAVNYAAAGTDAAQLEFVTASGLAADQSYFVRSNNASAKILFTGCEL